MIDRTHFTIVFEGDITKLKGNPLKMERPTGSLWRPAPAMHLT